MDDAGDLRRKWARAGVLEAAVRGRELRGV